VVGAHAAEARPSGWSLGALRRRLGRGTQARLLLGHAPLDEVFAERVVRYTVAGMRAVGSR
jgi:hypothetical protein